MSTNLALAAMNVKSPYKDIMNRYVPKVSYDTAGVFYDKETNALVFLCFSDNSFSEIDESHFVEVVGLVRPDNGLSYGMSDEELHSLHESDFCGEADDMSCYLYFKYVDSPIEVTPAKKVRKVNFVKLIDGKEFVNRDVLRRVSLFPPIREFAEKHNLLTTVFKSNEGRYACSSSMLAGFNNNPLGIDLAAVSAISRCFNTMADSKGKAFSGWHVYDSHGRYFVVQFFMWNEDGSTEYSKTFRYIPSSGLVYKKDFLGVDGYDYAIRTVEKYLPKVLASLQNIEIPIDLFEVCLAGASFSEEGWAGENSSNLDSYLKTGELGYPENKTHVLTGISYISSRNDFTRHSALKGKVALLIAQ